MITEHLLTKAKAYVALVGSLATALLALYGPDTQVGAILTVVVVLATAFATFKVPNAEEGYDWDELVGDDLRPDDQTPDDPAVGQH